MPNNPCNSSLNFTYTQLHYNTSYINYSIHFKSFIKIGFLGEAPAYPPTSYIKKNSVLYLTFLPPPQKILGTFTY